MLIEDLKRVKLKLVVPVHHIIYIITGYDSIFRDSNHNYNLESSGKRSMN
jgi:hypothetical protein